MSRPLHRASRCIMRFLCSCQSISRHTTHAPQPPPEEDLPPPDPEDALYAHLDEIDPPVKPDASSQPMSSTPTAPQPSGALSTPTKAKDPEVLPDAPPSQQAAATPKGTKRPLPPPPSLESMPAVVAEPSLLDSAFPHPSLAALTSLPDALPVWSSVTAFRRLD